MDKSYKTKMEERLGNHILTKEYVLNCTAKYNKKIAKYAYASKKYENALVTACGEENVDKQKMEYWIDARKPFMNVLKWECHMNIDQIKEELTQVKSKNIPAWSVCDQIRDMIVNGNYTMQE